MGNHEYVHRKGDPSRQEDFNMDCSILALRLRAQKDKLQQLCDRFLNEPRRDSTNKYIAVDEDFLLCVSSAIPRTQEDTGEIEEFPAYLEVYCAIRCKNAFPGGAPHVWFITDMFLSDMIGLPVATGREIFGFPKVRATMTPDDFKISSDMLRPFECLNVATYGLSTKVFKVEKAKKRTLIEITACDTKYVDDDDSFFVDFTKFTAVTLKQFRDVENKNRACYQAIVETSFISMDGNPQEVSSPGYSVWIAEEPSSHDIVRDLGLSSARHKKCLEFSGEEIVGVELQTKGSRFYRKASFTLETGFIRWSSLRNS